MCRLLQLEQECRHSTRDYPYPQTKRILLFRSSRPSSDLLDQVLSDVCNVCHQHPVGKFFVDFFIPEYSLIIEYDEPHHGTVSNTAAALAREGVIRELYPYSKIIRVTPGEELHDLGDQAEDRDGILLGLEARVGAELIGPVPRSVFFARGA